MQYRNVPLGVLCRCIFGGVLTQLGLFFVGFGLVFVWGIGLNADYSHFIFLTSDIETSNGIVTGCNRTGASESRGSSSSRRRPIYAVNYEFAHQGERFKSTSHTTKESYQTGDRVTIEFPAGMPELSRIIGTRRGMFSTAAMFVLIFPLVGAFIAGLGIKRGKKALRLVKTGMLAEGVLLRKEPTGGRINRRPIYRLYFEFTAIDGRSYTARDATHLIDRIADDRREQILYDPQRPADAMIVDAMPGGVAFDAAGRLAQQGFPVALLIIPLISTLGHGYYLFHLLTY